MYIAFAVWALAVVGIYSLPLTQLAHLAWDEHLYSHLFLVPLLSVYLVYLARHRVTVTRRDGRVEAVLIIAVGVAAIGVSSVLLRRPGDVTDIDALALAIFSFVSVFVGGFIFFFGFSRFRQFMFPLLFLYFLVPLPKLAELWIERGLQVGSAWTLEALLWIFRMPYIRTGTIFGLPGLTIEVAPQCSGIRSSLVLLITALLGGHLMLTSAWRKALLAFAAYPIGLLRNAFRILCIAYGTIHIDPGLIEGPVHHRGGPLFFVLSLFPLLLLLVILRKTEKARASCRPTRR